MGASHTPRHPATSPAKQTALNLPAMQYGSLLAVYFVVWWLTFVAVLPIGSHSHHETGADVITGADPGSPVRPMLLQKALLTTVLSVGFTALLLWGMNNPTLHAYWNR